MRLVSRVFANPLVVGIVCSFVHAFRISSLLILTFGLIGVFTGLYRSGEEAFLDTFTRMMGQRAALLLGVALVVSAASTMDSTFSSTAKLAVVDFRAAPSALHHASSPRSVTLTQLRFTSFAVTRLQRDLRPQECAHAGRTRKRHP